MRGSRLSPLAERRPQKQRDADRLFVKDRLADERMRAHHFTVIAGEYDDGVIALAGIFERLEDSRDALIHLAAQAPVIAVEPLPAGAAGKLVAVEAVLQIVLAGAADRSGSLSIGASG